MSYSPKTILWFSTILLALGISLFFSRRLVAPQVYNFYVKLLWVCITSAPSTGTVRDETLSERWLIKNALYCFSA